MVILPLGDVVIAIVVNVLGAALGAEVCTDAIISFL
jgi:hypothetical protein